jgi:copper transport protein
VRALVLAVAALLLAPAVASAHATLESTVPERGAQLHRAPAQVEFRFDESVEANFGALRVFDGHGREVQTGAAFHPGGRGNTVAVRLKSGLSQGSYTATYHVISADGHPVSSGFVFSVGHAAPPSESVDTLLAGANAGPVTTTALSVARGVQYGAIALAVGTVVFLLWCWLPALAAAGGAWDAAAAPFARRTDWLLWTAIVAGLLSAAAAIVLEGAVGLGASVWDAARPHVVDETLHTRFGTAWGLGLAAWMAAAVALAIRAASAPRPVTPATPAAEPPVPAPAGDGGAPVAVAIPPPAPAPAVAAPGRDTALVALAVPIFALVLLPSLGGHASVQSPVYVLLPANLVHVAAVSAWLGGVAVLALALRAATGSVPAAERTRMLTAVVSRFSALATVALPLFVLAGVVQGIVEVRTFAHLLDTAFGRAVLIKLVLVAGIAGLGYANRNRLLPALRRAEGTPGHAGVLLRRTLRAELALGLGALAATGALSGYPPSVEAAPGPYSTSVIAGPARIEVTVDPARTGPNQMHLYLFDRRTGAPFTRTKELKVTAALPHHGIAPLPISTHLAGPGHYVADSATLSVAGGWTVSITDRVSDFDEYATHFNVPIK